MVEAPGLAVVLLYRGNGDLVDSDEAERVKLDSGNKETLAVERKRARTPPSMLVWVGASPLQTKCHMSAKSCKE